MAELSFYGACPIFAVEAGLGLSPNLCQYLPLADLGSTSNLCQYLSSAEIEPFPKLDQYFQDSKLYQIGLLTTGQHNGLVWTTILDIDSTLGGVGGVTL